jgi:MATE family multidrug resistance protein
MGLTRYPSGSLREVLTISFPLMLTSLSFFSMVFVDRLFLASYDLHAMTAAVNASVIGWSFMVGLSIVAAIAEVFVGRRFGAGDTKNLGAPVWQMLWLSLFSFVLYIPLSLYGSEIIFGAERPEETIYLKWILFFAPFWFGYQAVAAFFIGQGKTVIIAVVSVLTNIINFGLDYFLIFGVGDWIPPLGIQGAVIATCFGTFFETAVLFAVFIRKKNRQNFGAAEWRFNYPLFKESFLIGMPAGLSMTLEVLGWSVFYEIMKWLGDNHIILAGIFQSLLMLFYFIPEGLQKGVTGIVANYIGEQRENVVPKILYSSFLFIASLFITLLFSSPFTVEWLRRGFLEGQDSLTLLLFGTWLLMLIYISFEGARATYIALLTAYKDTRFILFSGVASVWLFLALPFAILVAIGEPAELSALLLALLFPLGHTILLYARSRGILRKAAQEIS